MFRQILVAGIGSEMEIWGCHQLGLKWLSFNGLCEIGGWAQFSCWTCPHYKLVGFVFPILCRPAAVVLLIPTAGRGMRLLCVFFTPAFQVCMVMSLVVWASVEHCFTSREQCFTHFLPLLNQSQGPKNWTPILDCAKNKETVREIRTLLSLMSFSQLFLVFSSWQRQILLHCKVQLSIFPFIPAKRWHQQAL